MREYEGGVREREREYESGVRERVERESIKARRDVVPTVIRCLASTQAAKNKQTNRNPTTTTTTKMMSILSSATDAVMALFFGTLTGSGFLGQGEITWEDQFRFQA